MAVTVKIEPEEELTPRERREVVADLELFIALRSLLPRRDLQTLRQELANVVVDEAHGSESREIHPAPGEPVATASEAMRSAMADW